MRLAPLTGLLAFLLPAIAVMLAGSAVLDALEARRAEHARLEHKLDRLGEALGEQLATPSAPWLDGGHASALLNALALDPDVAWLSLSRVGGGPLHEHGNRADAAPDLRLRTVLASGAADAAPLAVEVGLRAAGGGAPAWLPTYGHGLRALLGGLLITASVLLWYWLTVRQPVARAAELAGVGGGWDEVGQMERAVQGLLAQRAQTGRAISRARFELRRERHARERIGKELEHGAQMLAHDLKTPLRTVRGFADLIVRRYGEQLAPEAREHLQQIRETSARMQRMVEGLTAIPALGEGEVEPVPLDELLDAALADLAGLLEGRSLDLARDPLPLVWGRPDALRRLLQNLLENAIRYQPGPVCRIVVACRSGDTHCIVTTRDFGVGIPADRHEDVFRPFCRLHPELAPDGTGLGLPACRRVLRAELGATDERAGVPDGRPPLGNPV